jgi:hypothetical protein
MENKTYSYKKSSHFRDMLNMSNEPNNIIPYTDTQFEEDLKKWFTETKMLQNKPFQMFFSKAFKPGFSHRVLP